VLIYIRFKINGDLKNNGMEVLEMTDFLAQIKDFLVKLYAAINDFLASFIPQPLD